MNQQGKDHSEGDRGLSTAPKGNKHTLTPAPPQPSWPAGAAEDSAPCKPKPFPSDKGQLAGSGSALHAALHSYNIHTHFHPGFKISNFASFSLGCPARCHCRIQVEAMERRMEGWSVLVGLLSGWGVLVECDLVIWCECFCWWSFSLSVSMMSVLFCWGERCQVIFHIWCGGVHVFCIWFLVPVWVWWLCWSCWYYEWWCLWLVLLLLWFSCCPRPPSDTSFNKGSELNTTTKSNYE